MAALTLATLMRTVTEALIFTIKIDAVFNWISSQFVWSWIRGDSGCFKPFVQNRVQKIRSLWVKELCSFFHTDFNPTDIASRGAKSSEITASDLWWKGHRRGQGSNPRLGLNFSDLSHSAKNVMIKFIHSNPHFKYMDNSCIIITETLSQGRMSKN